jgi:hypothetical protein
MLLGFTCTHWFLPTDDKSLITLNPNRCRACVSADLHGIRQYLPTFTHASDIPSIKFLSTLRIESLDQRLIAITRLTTIALVAFAQRAPSRTRLRSSCVWVLAYCLFDNKSWKRRLDCFQQVATVY